jgi:hypothetical protein
VTQAKVEGVEARLARLESHAAMADRGARAPPVSHVYVQGLLAQIEASEAETRRVKELLQSSLLFEQAMRNVAGSS